MLELVVVGLMHSLVGVWQEDKFGDVNGEVIEKGLVIPYQFFEHTIAFCKACEAGQACRLVVGFFLAGKPVLVAVYVLVQPIAGAWAQLARVALQWREGKATQIFLVCNIVKFHLILWQRKSSFKFDDNLKRK